ncbi:RNHCP domain-containing protein [Patescibacteria group bacterium]|nr:RNHCP domain-containing protein [Patescibacteria group bacterium]
MNKLFKRKIEDFICENCGAEVKGDGYTNHCPVCLWSKHVDINPGDRASECKGLMEPFEVEKIGEENIITHRCVKCGYKKKNKSSMSDDFDEILEIIG